MEIFLILLVGLILGILLLRLSDNIINYDTFLGILGALLTALSFVGLMLSIIAFSNHTETKEQCQNYRNELIIIKQALKNDSMDTDTFYNISTKVKEYNQFLEKKQYNNKTWLDWWVPDEVDTYEPFVFDYKGVITNN